jgi:hypothetical protein
MPRRLPRITRRLAPIELCSATEFTLTHWWIIPGIHPRDTNAWRQLWRQHRATILARWIECCPGTRPLACYATGEIPLPPLVGKPSEFSRVDILPDGTLLQENRFYDEPEHLAELGIVDDEEWNRYVDQVDRLGGKNAEGGGWYHGCEYRPVSRDGEE